MGLLALRGLGVALLAFGRSPLSVASLASAELWGFVVGVAGGALQVRRDNERHGGDDQQ